MSIPDHARVNFQTLLRAAASLPWRKPGATSRSSSAEILRPASRATSSARLGATERISSFTPFGHLADGNPFDAHVPPSEP
jgi:hypothetical protein